MDIKTFRAKSMQEALKLVRQELGPDASVLHTRELNGSLVKRVLFGRKYEVAASSNVNVPSRLPAKIQQGAGSREQGVRTPELAHAPLEASSMAHAPSSVLHPQVAGQLDRLQEMIERLCNQPALAPRHDLPETLFHVFTDMIEAEVDEA
ncbi:MAG: hypothetical protein AB7G28_23375, partial [Pirellulales bacterium]